MVVNIPVYVEGGKDIKRVAIVNVPWDDIRIFEDREEVCGTNNGIDVNDGHDAVPVAVEIRFHNPHTVVGVRVTIGLAILVDECT